MAKFCVHCGKPLEEGGVCSCRGKITKEKSISISTGVAESLMNRMGIGNPELNKGDAFEKGKQIVPDCVKSNENEIPVKQYTIATLKNRILGIPYMKAVGRIQVTNQRVVFRAPGRCLAGRTTLQQEFAIEEIAGIETRREYVFNFWNLLFGIIAIYAGAGVSSLFMSLFNAGFVYLFLLGIAIAGCVLFFMIKKKWILKLFCLGGYIIPYLFLHQINLWIAGLLALLWIISLILSLFGLLVYTIKPNLVLLMKTKASSEAISIKRKKNSLLGFGNDKNENTGYTEIIAEDNAEQSIRELGALIHDIQKLGDFGIEKWKV